MLPGRRRGSYARSTDVKKNQPKRMSLSLSRETVAVLGKHQLAEVAGGAPPETKANESCIVQCNSKVTVC